VTWSAIGLAPPCVVRTLRIQANGFSSTCQIRTDTQYNWTLAPKSKHEYNSWHPPSLNLVRSPSSMLHRCAGSKPAYVTVSE
jgi:hypothetical protein